MQAVDTDASDGQGTIAVNILSDLPEGDPQGSFTVRVSLEATGRDLLRQVCKQARVTLHPAYALQTDNGDPVSLDRPLTSVSSIQQGRILHWIMQDHSQVSGDRCWNVYWFLALLCFLIGCGGFVAIAYIYTHEPDNTKYGIVFDAGSSHTSMFIYKWEGEKINATAVAVQDGAKCNADGGGISSYANNSGEAGKSLVKCLDQAEWHIPTDKQKSTSIYLGATAGMRLLEKENPKASEAVLESVRNTIGSYPFNFTNPKEQARILPGSQEGAFSWIASNFITGSFAAGPPSDGIVPELIVPSVGALDLGGASTQITFVPNITGDMPKDYQFDTVLYGANYSLYTHSFLCYGVNEAAIRLQAVLIEAANFSGNISNPCAPQGSIVNVTHRDIFSSACVSGEDAALTFGYMILPSEEADQDTLYSFYGESNATACAALVSEHLFNLSAPCPYSDCSFNGVYQPSVFGEFYGISSYFYLMDFLNLTSRSSVNYTQFEGAYVSLCAKDWQEVRTMKTAVPQNLPWYCFQSIYVDTILVDGYKFDPNSTWNSIHFVESISGVDAGWTLGFMLDESNDLPAEKAKEDITVVTFVLLGILFAAFFLLAILFVRLARRYQRVSRRGLSFRSNGYGAI